jgi:hypothetical protein
MLLFRHKSQFKTFLLFDVVPGLTRNLFLIHIPYINTLLQIRLFVLKTYQSKYIYRFPVYY